MEGFASDNVCPATPVVFENVQKIQTTESAENFQKFMYDLFEKNGVINDLRAYLRGHIIEVLRSTHTGDPPACQKHFTQRLERPFQAMNILLAEYFLRLEFTYSLSVFISEIPLANMVFGFAKSLMRGDHGKQLTFKDEDVWSILNFLGVKCDSEHASNIVKMYRSEQTPLLLCMLKCMPMYTEPIFKDCESSNSLSSSVKSLDSICKISRPHHSASLNGKCKHLRFCKACQSQMSRIKEKYKTKKKYYAQNKRESSVTHMNSMLKNIDNVERCLIDEMFQQLKSTYDAEIEMMKNEEEKRLKKSVMVHTVELQKKQVQMEEKYKAREEELSRNVQQKKRFLWGLARLLREQHAQMSAAMVDIREESARLAAKEESLKSQLAEAEEVLKTRGEAMRRQISSELLILEGHLESMRQERDTIYKERMELDHFKNLHDNVTKTNKGEDIRPHYDLLKDEFQILKKLLETARIEPKCVIERSTITELADVTSKIDVALNNGQDVEKSPSGYALKAKQVVNNLKKLKNVNFSQPNLARVNSDTRSRSHSHSPTSSEAGDACDRERSSIQRLREENERLRTFARQQGEHIEELSSQQVRLSAELNAARYSQGSAAGSVRPRTAPGAASGAPYPTRRLGGSNTDLSQGWRKGAGEELSYFAHALPRILVPGDTLPFIGVVTERHTDNRRYLINQWRSLRHRVSPSGKTPVKEHSHRDRSNSAGPSIRLSCEDLNDDERLTPTEHRSQTAREEHLEIPETPKNYRAKSPKSVLREAKEKLKHKENKAKTPLIDREHSPNTVLREAKLRLKKLEIEAEAVEKSYCCGRLGGSNTDLSQGWRKGAGEELSYFAHALPRILVPGDTLPFIGVVTERHTDNRRYLINQWRSLRHRVSPSGKTPVKEHSHRDRSNSAGPSIRLSCEDLNDDERLTPTEHRSQTAREEHLEIPETPKNYRAKSPKSVLREAKEKLKHKENKAKTPLIDREHSPNTVLREAKLRLKKLEIEAEAVEKSYLDFRRKRETKRQSKFGDDAASERQTADKDYLKPTAKEKDLKLTRSASSKGSKTPKESTSHGRPAPEYRKYIEEYHTKYDLGITKFKNRNITSVKVKPIPPAFNANITSHSENKNYLETPIVEFRKYYQSEKRLTDHKVKVENDDGNFSGDSRPTVITAALSHEVDISKSPVKSRPNSSNGGVPLSPSLKADANEDKITTKSPNKSRGVSKSNNQLSIGVNIRSQSPIAKSCEASEDKNSSKTENYSETKDKAKGLEILKENIHEIYNISQKDIADNESFNKANVNPQQKDKSKLFIDDTTEVCQDEISSHSTSKDNIEEKNLLRIELQNVTQLNDLKITESQTQDLLLVVESTGGQSELDFQKDKPNTTILVHPQRREGSVSESEGIKSVKNDNEISSKNGHLLNSAHTDDAKSEVSSKQDARVTSDLEDNDDHDYLEEYSADAGNVNSNYDTESGERSPISMPKTSENDDFWNS